MEVKITVALALYRPERKYLDEQLRSLAWQECLPDELLVWNDSPADFDAVSILQEAELPFPWCVYGDGRQHGVTGAFEQLTRRARGKYIAYCDQDDVWAPRKLAVMKCYLDAHPSCLCCHAGVCLIDSGGNKLADLYDQSLAILNNPAWQIYHFLRENQTLGCAMLVRTVAAKDALPFPKRTYHDQWVALWCLFYGNGIHFFSEKLLYHRIHLGHASARLVGIENKQEYYEKKLRKDTDLLRSVIRCIPQAKKYYKDDIAWIKARNSYAKHPRWIEALNLWHLRHLRKSVTCFELLLPWLPKALLHQMFIYLRNDYKRLKK